MYHLSLLNIILNVKYILYYRDVFHPFPSQVLKTKIPKNLTKYK